MIENQVFDINKLPAEPGILVFPISMSRISNAQSAKECWEYTKIFSPDKIIKPMVGLNIIYGDYLYFNSKEPANILKSKFGNTILGHKNEFLKILAKNPMYIDRAASFSTWNQLLLEAKDFMRYSGELKKLFLEDRIFKKYVEEDAQKYAKEVTELHTDFILEETLMYYLIAKGKVILRNDFVQGHHKWVLWCYPGKPLKSMLYIQQKNPFQLSNSENAYEHAIYDLEERKLYDAAKLDLNLLNI
ncbi:MAG: hypothetical protein QOE22_513 [Candidatus Parcubacteria bacterium]|jgi:hypothetical protein|nr:hypothetical protein [Candidatus Parcubacteria bacterium]